MRVARSEEQDLALVQLVVLSVHAEPEASRDHLDRHGAVGVVRTDFDVGAEHDEHETEPSRAGEGPAEPAGANERLVLLQLADVRLQVEEHHRLGQRTLDS